MPASCWKSAQSEVKSVVVTIKLTDATLQHTLDAILIPRGFRYELTAKDGDFWVTVKKAR